MTTRTGRVAKKPARYVMAAQAANPRSWTTAKMLASYVDPEPTDIRLRLPGRTLRSHRVTAIKKAVQRADQEGPYEVELLLTPKMRALNTEERRLVVDLIPEDVYWIQTQERVFQAQRRGRTLKLRWGRCETVEGEEATLCQPLSAPLAAADQVEGGQGLPIEVIVGNRGRQTEDPASPEPSTIKPRPSLTEHIKYLSSEEGALCTPDQRTGNTPSPPLPISAPPELVREISAGSFSPTSSVPLGSPIPVSSKSLQLPYPASSSPLSPPELDAVSLHASFNLNQSLSPTPRSPVSRATSLSLKPPLPPISPIAGPSTALSPELSEWRTPVTPGKWAIAHVARGALSEKRPGSVQDEPEFLETRVSFDLASQVPVTPGKRARRHLRLS